MSPKSIVYGPRKHGDIPEYIWITKLLNMTKSELVTKTKEKYPELLSDTEEGIELILSDWVEIEDWIDLIYSKIQNLTYSPDYECFGLILDSVDQIPEYKKFWIEHGFSEDTLDVWVC